MRPQIASCSSGCIWLLHPPVVALISRWLAARVASCSSGRMFRCSRIAGHAEVLFLCMAIVSWTTPLVADGLLLGLLYAPRVASSGAPGQQVVLRSIPQLGHRISHNIFRQRARDTYNILLCVMAWQSHDTPPQPEYLDHLECQR